MLARTLLAVACVSMSAGAAWLSRPAPVPRAPSLGPWPRARGGSSPVEEAPLQPAPRMLRVMTWNVGYADLEADSRARTDDMEAVARAIRAQDPDAVALQELAGAAQLRALLAALGPPWAGHLAELGASDRYEAVLVRGRARFEEAPCAGRYAAAARFRTSTRSGGGSGAGDEQAVLLVSVHTPAYSALGRRRYVDALVEWVRQRRRGATVLLAGDFNLDVAPAGEENVFTDDPKRDGESYSQLVREFRDLGRHAGATAIGPRRIDYVFGEPSATPRRAEVIAGASVGRMDHAPLLVEVALP